MYTYINKTDKSVVVSPEELPADSGYVLLQNEYPEYDQRTQDLVKDGEPTLNKKQGCYIQKYKVVPLSDERIAAHLEDARNSRRAEAATIRWNHEIGGIIIPSGIQVLTDSNSQLRLTMLVQNARDAGLEKVDFKAASGFVVLTFDELLDVSKAVTAHVQSCYANEARLNKLLDEASDFDAIAAVNLDEGWPEFIDPEASENKPSEVEVTFTPQLEMPSINYVFPDIVFPQPDVNIAQA